MPASTPPRRAGNLPNELTSFVGRRREVAEIKRRISSSRLVTLTGVGGAGKTRLSLRVAADLRRAFPDGVWFVELAALEDEALLTQTIASALDLLDRTARWQVTDLAEYLRDKHLLLVLDNCEHLRDACALLAANLLRNAPGLRILATSRQALGLTGEHIFQVPTMSLPLGDQVPPPAALSQYEAVTLFMDRATAVQPTFALSDDNFHSVVRVCQRLDGLPLAIELTAVRLRALSIDEILERLEDRFRLLTTGSPVVLPRHQTLRGLIDWSNDLCTPAERTLWARLSVFSGGFDLEAVEAVCTDHEVGPETVLDLVSALVDKSIVVTETQSGRVRYRLLETIRQYGYDRLRESGTEIAMRQRHRDYFADLVDRAWSEWLGSNQQQWLERLLSEHNNVRAALEFCLTRPHQAEIALRVAGELWFFWIATGLTGEGRRWLGRALQVEGRPSRWHARALWVAAYLSVLQEDIATAKPMIATCQEYAEKLGDANATAWARQVTGMVKMSTGDLAGALADFADTLARHHAGNDLVATLDVSFYLAMVAALLGDRERASAACAESLALCDRYGERWLRSYIQWDLGLVAWQSGDVRQAVVAVQDSLRLARTFNERWAIAFCIEMLAWTADADGQHQRAARLLGGADDIWKRIGAPMFGFQHLKSCHDECMTRVRQALGARAFHTEFEQGRELGIDEAISFALEEPCSAAPAKPLVEAETVLSPREREVAQLIAQGMSNREIAATLVISRRTAEAHVENILGKLGFTSRTQVAAWVAELRGRSADCG